MRCGAALWISNFPTYKVLCFILLPLVQLLVNGGAEDAADHVQTVVTVCDGDQAALNWPCDVQYDLVKYMTLTYSWSGRQGLSMVTIFGNGSVTVTREFSTRIKVRGTSGVYLTDVSIRDAGIYVFDGQFENGTDITKQHVSLVVHVPPLVEYGRLTIQMTNQSKHCQGLSCGRLVFLGYPPASIAWTAPDGSEAGSVSNQRNVIQGCPLQYGNYSCHLTGPAVKCLRNNTPLEESMFVNVSWIEDDNSKKMHDLVLIITVPIVVVVFPLLILGLWVLKHLLTDNTYSELPEKASSAEMNRSTSRTSASALESPTFSQNLAETPETEAGIEEDEDDNDDVTTPMVRPESDSGSAKDEETRI